MNDGTGGGQSVCMGIGCSKVFDGQASHCPHCGAKAITRDSLRRRGWFLVACGILLLGLMAWVLAYLVPPMLAGGEEVEGSRFTGTQEDVQMIMGVLGAVVVFGLASLASGLIQAIQGVRPRAIIVVMLVLAAGLFAFGMAVRRGLLG
ncbi:MAG: hypothetical protein KDE15_04795 [Erythrobacter sp.]|nr:hypothetical protein [Erythrobacter sp.]